MVDADIQSLEELCQLLEPFKTATAVLSSEKQCTISVVHPTKHTLLKHLTDSRYDRSEINTAKDAMLNNLRVRYVNIAYHFFHFLRIF